MFACWTFNGRATVPGHLSTRETKVSTEMTKRFFSGLLLATLTVAPLSGIIGCDRDNEPVETAPTTTPTTDVDPVETE